MILLHALIVLVVVRLYLEQIGRIDGPTEIPTAIELPKQASMTTGEEFAAERQRSRASRAETERLLILDFIRTSVLGIIRTTTHLDHVSRCKTASGIDRSKRWTYRVSIASIQFLKRARRHR